MSKRRSGKEIDVEGLRHRDLLSRREVAFLWGCSERFVIRLIEQGLLVEVSLGRHKRIPRWSLDKYTSGATQANAA